MKPKFPKCGLPDCNNVALPTWNNVPRKYCGPRCYHIASRASKDRAYWLREARFTIPGPKKTRTRL